LWPCFVELRVGVLSTRPKFKKNQGFPRAPVRLQMYQRFSLRPQMKIAPQVVIGGRLLRASGSGIEQLVNNELASNPALELASQADLGDAKRHQRLTNHISNWPSSPGLHHSKSFEDIEELIPQSRPPIERLIEQVTLMADKTEQELAVLLLYRLDHRGFLIVPAEELASELGTSGDRIERAVRILHLLEPPGIGARDIRECFLIQCAHLEADGIDCQRVRQILTAAWDDFLNQRWDRVATQIHEPISVVEQAREFMRLNFCPYPLAMLEASTGSAEDLNYPDLVILRENHDGSPPIFKLQIPGAEEFELRICANFQETLRALPRSKDESCARERSWIRGHMDRAQELITALNQRWETLWRLGEYLIHYQNDFLVHGSLHLKPLTRAAVAQRLGLHESTISRAVSDKTVQLPDGRLIPLRDFFDSAVATKEAIRRLLRENCNSLSDREIAEGLEANGMNFSRRTVTKYRREMNLQPSHRRGSIGDLDKIGKR